MEDGNVRFAAAMTFTEFEELSYLLAGSPQLSGWRRVWITLRFVFVAAMITTPFYSWYSRLGPLASTSSEQNLWLAVVPTSIIAIGCVRRSEYTRAKLGIKKRSLWIWQILYLVQLLLLIPVVFERPAISWHPMPAQFIASALLPWLVYRAIVELREGQPSRFRRAWKDNPALSRELEWTVGDGEITSTSNLYTRRFRWPFFARYEESASFLVLHTIDSWPVALPKRGLDPTALGRLRTVIRQNIASGSFVVPICGFEVSAENSTGAIAR